MNLPGFDAEASIYRTQKHYAETAAATNESCGLAVPAGDFFSCYEPCMQECMAEFPSPGILYCNGLCTALCGDPFPGLGPGFFDPPPPPPPPPSSPPLLPGAAGMLAAGAAALIIGGLIVANVKYHFTMGDETGC